MRAEVVCWICLFEDFRSICSHNNTMESSRRNISTFGELVKENTARKQLGEARRSIKYGDIWETNGASMGFNSSRLKN